MDWAALTRYASEVRERAYAPYSGFKVGAAGLVEDGRVVLGCNVENASYAMSLCAESGLVSALHATGGGRLVAVAIVGPGGQLVTPCGHSRQVLWENGGADLQVQTPSGVRPMSEVLPDAFDASDLRRAGASAE
ncbi:MAG: cytidine deaminase [Aeromicrobium sp.]